MQQSNFDHTINNPPQPRQNQKFKLSALQIFAAILLVLIVGLIILQRLKTPTEPTLPPASPAPSPITTSEEKNAIRTFNWSVSEMPYTNNFTLYSIETPLTDFVSIASLINILGFQTTDLVDDSPAQKVWSNNRGTLSVGISPQYFYFKSNDPDGIEIDQKLLSEQFAQISGVTLGVQEQGVITITNWINGTTSTLNVIQVPINQKLEGLDIISNANTNLGSIVFNQSTGKLFSININGGFRQVVAKGLVPSLNLDELRLKAEVFSVAIGAGDTIEESQEFYTTPQSINVFKLASVYFSSPNSKTLLPGYLLSGTNQDGKEANFFIPAQ